MGNAFPALITELTHVNDLFEAHGKMGGVMMLASIVFRWRLALHGFPRAAVALLRSAGPQGGTREGRVVAREEQINRANGRDPIEKYFFSLRYLNMPVNLAAYRALEAGSVYIVYLLPAAKYWPPSNPKWTSRRRPSPRGCSSQSKAFTA